jgi:hypothetical protein
VYMGGLWYSAALRMVLSPKEYVRLCTQYRVRIRSLFTPPIPPTYYARVATREDNTLISYLWWNDAREEWIAFDPDLASEEVTSLFSA